MFKRMKVLAGDVDPQLLANGELGRAVVTGLDRTGVFAGPADFDARQVCVVTLDVRLDNQPMFTAEVRQQIATPDLAQIVPGHSIVAVRVDPTDHSKVAIDLSTPPPVVTIPSSDAVTAASILAAGKPVRAVIVNSDPMYAKNVEGVEIYAFKLTILADGSPPRPVRRRQPRTGGCTAAPLPRVQPAGQADARPA